ncbi:MAG: glucodextranase DOMON-like domain-containing protein [Desulfurococcaceae archaeon]
MQYIHVYIHTALNELGRNNTFGLNINIAEEHSWHMAILIAPGWGTDPVPIGERTALYYSNGSVIPQNGDLRVYADQSLGLIVVEASKGVLVNVEDIDKWIYVVALTSYDGYGSDRIRPFSTSPDVWIVGAPDYSLAIAANVIPRVMDLLAPTAEEQYSMLKSFNVTFIDAQLVGRPAVVKGYGRAAPQPTVTTIVTTVALTTTLTEATTATSTLTIRELTIAASTTTLTETITEIAPQELNIPLSTALVFTGLLVGIAATYLFMRRRSIEK